MDRLAAISIGVVILLRVGIGFIQDAELPSALQWLHPWSLSGLLNWLVNGLFYIIEEGGDVMTSLVKTAGFAILGFLILGGFDCRDSPRNANKGNSRPDFFNACLRRARLCPRRPKG